MIGDESCMPTTKACFTNLVKASAIPAAFIVGCLMSAASAGTLAGPSAALAPMVSGMVVRGVVIDSAALVAGAVMASRAQMIADLLVKKDRDKFMCVTPMFNPGERYLMVKGGLSEGSVTIEEIPKKKVKGLRISAMKRPMEIHEEPKMLMEKEANHYHLPATAMIS